MTTAMNDRFLATIWGILLLAAALTPIAVRGEDPAPACPKCSTVERGIPVFDKIPFVSRLFKKVGACESQTGAAQNFERIGIDFDFEVCPDCPVPLGISSAACTQNAGVQLFAVRRAAHQHLAAACCETEKCCGKDCEESLACCKDACCQSACETAKRSGLSWELIVELTATNAALEASLEAQTAFHEEKSELMESFVEIAIEKAKLEAQVETLHQQAHLTKEMLALISENARLKAQVESAETKLAIVHEMTKLAIENQQLKLALQVATTGKGDPTSPDTSEAIQTSNRRPEAKPAR
ncbi:MAG: hypothetical protein ACR2FY_09565 [Pirellulaceae bacterium]